MQIIIIINNNNKLLQHAQMNVLYAKHYVGCFLWYRLNESNIDTIKYT